jgi:hypothetical protein
VRRVSVAAAAMTNQGPGVPKDPLHLGLGGTTTAQRHRGLRAGLGAPTTSSSSPRPLTPRPTPNGGGWDRERRRHMNG